MNEEKLKKRMNQRKEELEAEREQLLRESINLSNKCNGFPLFFRLFLIIVFFMDNNRRISLYFFAFY